MRPRLQPRRAAQAVLDASERPRQARSGVAAADRRSAHLMASSTARPLCAYDKATADRIQLDLEER